MAITLSIVGLFFAPFLVLAFGRGRKWDALFDGYVLVTMVGLVGWEMLPHSIHEGGLAAALVIGLGMLFPNWLERRSHGHGRVAWLAFAGLLFHALLDGAALGFVGAHDGHAAQLGHSHSHGQSLEWAVILHRLPVGLMVFTMVEQLRGRAAAIGAIAALAVATLAGFSGGAVVTDAMSNTGAVLFEAFVIGALLHVVFHDHASHHHAEPKDDCCRPEDDCSNDVVAPPAPDPCCGDSQSEPPTATQSMHADEEHDHGHDPAENHDHDHDHHAQDQDHGDHDHGGPQASAEGVGAVLGFATLGVFAYSGGVTPSGEVLLHLFLESSPALVFAYLAAGLLSATALSGGIAWMGRGSQLSQAARGMAFGLPLPVCSCGVLPLYESLARRGAPATAGLAFLVATPELGVDAVLLSIPLLGPELTAARVLAAVVVALVAALVVGRLLDDESPPEEAIAPKGPLGARLLSGLRYGLGELVDHTLPWILLGVGIAAIIEPILSPAAFASVPPLAQVPLFALLGIPLYICASGATPFAAVLIFSGVSPGAALAFLLTGPATNVTTFGVLSKLHGRRVAVVFGVVVTLAAIASGWTVDATLPEITIALDPHEHGSVPLIQIVSAAALATLFLSSLFRQGPRGMLHQVFKPHQ